MVVLGWQTLLIQSRQVLGKSSMAVHRRRVKNIASDFSSPCRSKHVSMFWDFGLIFCFGVSTFKIPCDYYDPIYAISMCLQCLPYILLNSLHPASLEKPVFWIDSPQPCLGPWLMPLLKNKWALKLGASNPKGFPRHVWRLVTGS